MILDGFMSSAIIERDKSNTSITSASLCFSTGCGRFFHVGPAAPRMAKNSSKLVTRAISDRFRLEPPLTRAW